MSVTNDQILQRIEAMIAEIIALPQRLTVVGGQVQVHAGLSDISVNLGVVTAGEFRAGNGRDPGKGFTGVRIAYPGMTYSGSDWHIVGVNNDALQFGLRATDGVAVAGGGVVTLNSNGISIDVPTSGVVDVIRSYRFVSGSSVQSYVSAYINTGSNINSIVVEAVDATRHNVIGITAPKYSSRNASVVLSAGSASLSLSHIDSSGSIVITASAKTVSVSQSSISSADPSSALSVVGGLHTGLTASAELNSVYIELRTAQWAAGSLSNQRAIRIIAPTYSFVGASTITNAATVYIEGAPVAGTNATITNNYALWVDAGVVRFDDEIRGGAGLRLNGLTSGARLEMREISLTNTSVGQLLNVSGNGAGTIGWVWIIDDTGAQAMFAVTGSVNNTIESLDPNGVYSVVSGTATSTNVYWSAGNSRYEIENRRGSTVTYRIMAFING